jgi:putative ABC transport system permease protein
MLVNGWNADIRDAARAIRARPVAALGTALLSAIAGAAIASAAAVVYGILVRPLPYPEAARLAVIWQVRGGERTQLSYPDYQDLAGLPVFESAAAISGGRGSLRVGDRIERINLLSIESPGLAMLGARPLLGRLLTAADADRGTALISHRLWATHLNSDPLIIGRRLWLSGTEYTVVGVLQPGFDFELPVPPAFVLEDNDVWTVLERSVPFITRRDVSTYEALVRLAPGRTLREAQAALDSVGQRLEKEHATNAGRGFHVALLANELMSPVRRLLMSVGFVALITLGIALANLMVLNLVRGAERQIERAVREALGAERWRLRRQVLTEHALVVGCGTLGGLALAFRSVEWIIGNEAAHLPRPDAIRFDAPVLAVTGSVGALIVLALTWQPMPAWDGWLRAGSRLVTPSSRRSRRMLVGTEIMLAVTLATGGALLALSLTRLLATNSGFDPRGVSAARVSAYEAEYRTRDDVVRFFEDIVAGLEQTPGVDAAGAGSSLPLSGQFSGTGIVPEGRRPAAGEHLTAGWQFVTPGYLGAVGMRLLAGRDFSATDRTRAAHVTVVNEHLARLLFPGENPLGRRISVGGGHTQGDWHEIIGVVADVKHQALDAPPAPRVYDLFGQHWGRTLYVIARAEPGAEAPPINSLRTHIADVNPAVPVFDGATLSQLVDRSAGARRLASRIVNSLAIAGVLMALIGVYAITSATVTERTREIGVRAALGATPRDVFRLIAAEAASPALWGSGAGILASWLAARLLASHLFEIHAVDAATTIAAVVTTMILASLFASVPPGRRAAAANPLAAMRTD